MDFHCQAGEHQLLLKDLCMNSQRVLLGDDLEGRSPLRRDEVGYFSLLFFMEYVADTSSYILHGNLCADNRNRDLI